MKVFTGTALSVLALAAATVYHRDPAGHFHRASYRFEKNWDAGRNLVYPSVIDERGRRPSPGPGGGVAACRDRGPVHRPPLSSGRTRQDLGAYRVPGAHR